MCDNLCLFFTQPIFPILYPDEYFGINKILDVNFPRETAWVY